MKKKPDNITQADWDAVDSPELSDGLLLKMDPVSKKHPNFPRKVRGVQKAPTKVPVSIRLSSDVVDFFRSKGKGWQGKIDLILNEYVKTH